MAGIQAGKFDPESLLFTIILRRFPLQPHKFMPRASDAGKCHLWLLCLLYQPALRATGVGIMEAKPPWWCQVKSMSITWVCPDNSVNRVRWRGCCPVPLSLQFSESTSPGLLVASGLFPTVYNRTMSPLQLLACIINLLMVINKKLDITSLVSHLSDSRLI